MAQNKNTPQEAPTVNGSAVAHANLAATAAAPKFDIGEFRTDQGFGLAGPARKKAVEVEVGRPNRQSWIVIHPDPAWRVPVNLFEDKNNERIYLVAPNMAPEVTEDLVNKLLVAYVTRTGSPGLWPIRLPDDSGRLDTYSESALTIVSGYSGQWVRVLTDQSVKRYTVMTQPPMDIPAPNWPDSFAWMFETAFKARVIRSLDHPALVSLRGGVLGA